MKLTFKDLKQVKFVIEAEPTDLISAVKEKIAAEKGYDASLQKLIYSGKILQDANTVESYKIEEKGFIVCMVSKPKAAPAAVVPPSTPAPAVVAATPAPPAAPSQAASSSTPAVPSTPSPAQGPGATASTPSFDASGLAMGSARAAAIAEMESMGFERSQIDLAMRAAFYNSERAIEYLLNGIPDNIEQEAARAPPAQATQQTPASPTAAATAGEEESLNLFEQAAAAQGAGRGAGGAGAGAGNLFAGAPGGQGAGLGNLDFLRNNAQFQQLRQVVQQNPQMLEPILQQLGAGNPQLAALIGNNPDDFLRLLSENSDEDAPLPPGAQSISVTEEERAAIERLCLLGFPRDQAIQAYFACDKNEELAANFLFEQPEDDEQ